MAIMEALFDLNATVVRIDVNVKAIRDLLEGDDAEEGSADV